MKVALNPEELRLIVDALDDKRQFQLQSEKRREGWTREALTPSAGNDVDRVSARNGGGISVLHDAVLEAAGLERPVEVERDPLGIPTIRGA